MWKNFVDAPARKIFCYRSFRIQVENSRHVYGDLAHNSLYGNPCKKMTKLWTRFNLNYLHKRIKNKLTATFSVPDKSWYNALGQITCQWDRVRANSCFSKYELTPGFPRVCFWLTPPDGPATSEVWCGSFALSNLHNRGNPLQTIKPFALKCIVHCSMQTNYWY